MFVIFGLQIGLVAAQESTSSSGGDAVGNGGTLSFTVGQIVYTTNTGSNGNSAQGVQHAYEIFTVGTPESILDRVFAIYPNPTTDGVTLTVSNWQSQDLKYLVFDLSGKLLFSGEIAESKTHISLHNYPSAPYLIHIVDEAKRIKTFRIAKVN
jgi:hypothetical protein